MILKGTKAWFMEYKNVIFPKFCSILLMDKGLLTRIIAKEFTEEVVESTQC